ncbi:hypothetical protein ACIBHX_05425 [Nonomuraea sp. NPDC050536]|uniref:hypothetical protein n=1 Tax=Nonomuraea sp. NPDC050536 TaxID=3364366 RepID=UPI0037C70559
MSETDPGYIEGHAGDVGSRRATIGTPIDEGSINVPQRRPGATENAEAWVKSHERHDVFVPASRITGGDVLDTTGDEESKAVRLEEERENPLIAARDAMEADLEGR